jgi:hypothetical protein
MGDSVDFALAPRLVTCNLHSRGVGAGGSSAAHDDEDEEKRRKGRSHDNDYGLE